MSRGGVSVSVSPERLAVGSTLDATLSLADAQAGLSVLVVHRGFQSAGLRVLEWTAGRQKVLHLLDDLGVRAFGGRKEKRKMVTPLALLPPAVAAVLLAVDALVAGDVVIAVVSSWARYPRPVAGGPASPSWPRPMRGGSM